MKKEKKKEEKKNTFGKALLLPLPLAPSMPCIMSNFGVGWVSNESDLYGTFQVYITMHRRHALCFSDSSSSSLYFLLIFLSFSQSSAPGGGPGPSLAASFISTESTISAAAGAMLLARFL